MDNLTHTLFALALSRVKPLSRHRLAMPAWVVAANFPDVDVAPRLFLGAVGYLEYHRGITHALVGIVGQTLLLLLGFGLLARWIARSRGDPDSARIGSLAWPIGLGLVSHFVLDCVISYGIRPWLPFSPRWYYGDLVFVVDPWLWLCFGIAAACCGTRSERGDRAWLIAVAVASLVVFFDPLERASLALRAAWFPAIVAAAVARSSGFGARRPLWVGAACLAATLLYGATLFTAKRSAESIARAELAAILGDDAVVEVALLPQPTRPFRWMCVARTAGEIVWLEVEAFSGASGFERSPIAPDDPRVDRARATPDGRVWESFVRFPWIRVVGDGEDATVVLSDARYWYTDFCAVAVQVGAK